MTTARSRGATSSARDADVTPRPRIAPVPTGDARTNGRRAIGVDLLRLGWGSLLLFSPETALRAAHADTTPLARGVARTLGTRQLLCAVATGSVRLAGRRSQSDSLEALLRRVVASVDGIHAGTAVVFAAATDERRSWLADALISAAFGVGTWRTAR